MSKILNLPYMSRNAEKKYFSRPKVVALIGAAGKVTPTFYEPALRQLLPVYSGVQFLAVDKIAGVDVSHIQLPWINPHTIGVNDFALALWQAKSNKINLNREQIPLAGAIIAVPPHFHPVLTQILVEKLPLVMVEKPLVFPKHLNNIEALYRAYPDKLFPVDFFLDSSAIRFLIKHKDELLHGLGKLRRIEATLKENWPVEKGREWLVDDGLGWDLLPHLYAMEYLLLKEQGLSTEMKVIAAKRAKYVNVDGATPLGRNETYMWIKVIAGDVEIVMD